MRDLPNCGCVLWTSKHSCKRVLKSQPTADHAPATIIEWATGLLEGGAGGWWLASKGLPCEDHFAQSSLQILWKSRIKRVDVEGLAWFDPFLCYYTRIRCVYIDIYIYIQINIFIYIHTQIMMMFRSPLLVTALLWPSSQGGGQFLPVHKQIPVRHTG